MAHCAERRQSCARDFETERRYTGGGGIHTPLFLTEALVNESVPRYTFAVKSACHIAHPPPHPVMVYDGDCGFCVRWIQRWQRLTPGQVDYLAAQDARVAAQFPEIAQEHYLRAVHFVAIDGSVYFGAEAVFRSLAVGGRYQWLLQWYQRSPAFAWLTEAAYRFVGRRRGFFSKFG
jgi:predicted DCC family thiol-disulfide oxidoreductase YuxK